MKFLPLIWAALARKPARAILTLVSVMIGFTLFGLTIGVGAGFRHLADSARMDRLYVSSRYGGSLTLAQRDLVARHLVCALTLEVVRGEAEAGFAQAGGQLQRR